VFLGGHTEQYYTGRWLASNIRIVIKLGICQTLLFDKQTYTENYENPPDALIMDTL
jgi:hypothetical protein